jgi:hypothetical protein
MSDEFEAYKYSLISLISIALADPYLRKAISLKIDDIEVDFEMISSENCSKCKLGG